MRQKLRRNKRINNAFFAPKRRPLKLYKLGTKGTNKVIKIQMKAEGGEFHISTEGATPNVQIGNHNQMVVYQGADGEQFRNLNIRPKRDIIDSKDVPGNDAMNIVATHIGKEWRRLGSALGLSNGELDNVKLDHYAEGHYEISYQMLRKWKEQAYPTELGRLAMKCSEIGRGDVSDRLAEAHGTKSA